MVDFKKENPMRNYIKIGVAGPVGKGGKADAEFLHGGRQALFGRQIEQDAGLGRHGQPGVLGQFFFKLTSIPAGIAQCNEDLRRQAGTAAPRD